MGGEKHVRAGGQLYQSSYLSLQTPYIIFGLGRTSNYVDDFAYAVPLHHVSACTISLPSLPLSLSLTTNNLISFLKGRHYNYWICIIPNSQLVAIPYHPNLPETYVLSLLSSAERVNVLTVWPLFFSGGNWNCT